MVIVVQRRLYTNTALYQRIDRGPTHDGPPPLPIKPMGQPLVRPRWPPVVKHLYQGRPVAFVVVHGNPLRLCQAAQRQPCHPYLPANHGRCGFKMGREPLILRRQVRWDIIKPFMVIGYAPLLKALLLEVFKVAIEGLALRLRQPRESGCNFGYIISCQGKYQFFFGHGLKSPLVPLLCTVAAFKTSPPPNAPHGRCGLPESSG